MGELGFCHFSDIISAIKTQLVSDIAADSGWPIILVRILHNKIISGLFFSLRCYFLYFDFAQIFNFVSPFLLPFLIIAYLGKRWRKGIILFTLMFPVIFIFFLKKPEIGTKIYIFQGFYIFIALIGWIKLTKVIISNLRKG